MSHSASSLVTPPVDLRALASQIAKMAVPAGAERLQRLCDASEHRRRCNRQRRKRMRHWHADEVECVPCDDDKPRPEPLFTGEEKRHETTVKKHGKNVPVCVSSVCPDGTLMGGCHHTCKNKYVRIERFAPDENDKNSAGKHQNFMAANEAFNAAYAANDKAEAVKQRAIVERLRTINCDTCRERKLRKLSPKQQACKDEWDFLRKEACERQNGCANQECSERGMAAWIALQADHGLNTKMKDKNGKPVVLSDYNWWSGNGGVPAMREEAEQIYQWICGTCHSLEDTSNQGRVNDPYTMEKKETETDREFNKRKQSAKIKFPKYEYVNAKKCAIGLCEYPGCGREVVAGNEVGFHWDHLVESTKRMCRCLNDEGKAEGPCHKCPDQLFGRDGGVGGLANNSVKAAALDANADPVGKIKDLLDAEMDKCHLLCVPCHLSRKPRGLGRWEVACLGGWSIDRAMDATPPPSPRSEECDNIEAALKRQRLDAEARQAARDAMTEAEREETAASANRLVGRRNGPWVPKCMPQVVYASGTRT